MSKLSLRPATEADVEFLRRVYRESFAGYVAQAHGWDEARQMAEFDSNLDLPTTQVVCLDGQDVGLLAIVQTPGVIVLKQVGLLPGYQGKGLGTRLVQALLRRADREGQPVRLAVLKCNPAWKLYERLGFTVTRSSNTHYYMRRAPQKSGAGGDG